MQFFQGLANGAGRAVNVHRVHAGVAVGKALVVVGGDFDGVGMAQFNELVFHAVLIVNHQRAFHVFLVGHRGQVASLRDFGVVLARIAQKHASVAVAGGFDEVIKGGSELVVGAEGKDTTHGRRSEG